MQKVRDTDRRSLNRSELIELCIRGVNTVQAGQSPADEAAALGPNRTTVYDWLFLYRKGGWHALDAHKRGGRRPTLTGDVRWLYNMITMKEPLEIKCEFALRTVPMMMDVIPQELDVKLSRSSVTRLLHQLGLSPQRPLWRAYQQNPEAVEHCIFTEFVRIKRRAKQPGAEIFFGDEAGVRSDRHAGTTWPPRGKTPVPDELMWNKVKNELGKLRHETKEEMKRAAMHCLLRLQKCKDTIKGLFKKSCTVYVASLSVHCILNYLICV